MARIIVTSNELKDEHQLLPMLERVKRFIMEELPDYVCVGFDIMIEKKEIDAMILLPHMGVFILQIHAARTLCVENGGVYMEYGTRRVMMNPGGDLRFRYLVKDYFLKRFGLVPLVYEISCFPELLMREEDLLRLEQTGKFHRDHIMAVDDFRSGLDFMRRLSDWAYYSTLDPNGQEYNSIYFDDLTDELTERIFRTWENPPVRPARPKTPPMAFLSYNKNNSTLARKIKAQLEKRGIFTWRAPEDVRISQYFLTKEMAAIEASDAFVILLSASSMKSPEVKKEIVEAKRLNKPIIPLMIEDCPIPPFYEEALREHQYRIMTGTIDAAIIDEITEVLFDIRDGKSL